MPFTCELITDTATMEAVRQVRRRVFIEEQRVPEAEEWDDFDAAAAHIALRDGAQVIGTARVVEKGDGSVKIGRVAVLPQARGRGGGALLMATAMAHARRQGARVILLDAQLPVIPFYERLGFAAEGEVFMDAGIPHRRMTLSGVQAFRCSGGQEGESSEPERPNARTPERPFLPLRVGIAGARGIGRHQAKWFAQVGCEVAAIYGTTEATAMAAAEGVRALFDFCGRVEWDWGRFVQAPDLDAISVCSPPPAHAANALAALKAGKHVLCEKPLVWDWEGGPEQMRAAAREVVAAAAAAGRVLALNAQYPAAAEPLLQLFRTANNREPDFQRVVFCMETAGAPRSAHGPAEVWADLGPHPLAFADRLLAGGAPDVGSARREESGTDAVLHLDWNLTGRTVPITFELRRIKDKAAVRREFSIDGWTAAYQARNVNGEFKAVLAAPPHEWVGEDFMRASVRRFVEAARANDPAHALVTGEEALRQFEAQVALWERCFR